MANPVSNNENLPCSLKLARSCLEITTNRAENPASHTRVGKIRAFPKIFLIYLVVFSFPFFIFCYLIFYLSLTIFASESKFAFFLHIVKYLFFSSWTYRSHLEDLDTSFWGQITFSYSFS